MNEAGATSDRRKQRLGDPLTAAETDTQSQDQADARQGRRIRVAAIVACAVFWGFLIYYALG